SAGVPPVAKGLVAGRRAERGRVYVASRDFSITGSGEGVWFYDQSRYQRVTSGGTQGVDSAAVGRLCRPRFQSTGTSLPRNHPIGAVPAVCRKFGAAHPFGRAV